MVHSASKLQSNRYPYFDRMQIKKISKDAVATEKELTVATELCALARNDVKEVAPDKSDKEKEKEKGEQRRQKYRELR